MGALAAGQTEVPTHVVPLAAVLLSCLLLLLLHTQLRWPDAAGLHTHACNITLSASLALHASQGDDLPADLARSQAVLLLTILKRFTCPTAQSYQQFHTLCQSGSLSE